MFKNYELLKCDICKAPFMGRKPEQNIKVLCYGCLVKSYAPIVDDGDPIPDTVLETHEGGKGEDD